MDQEEDNEESRDESVAHFAIIIVVLDSPEEVAEDRTNHRKREVGQTVDVESLQRLT